LPDTITYAPNQFKKTETSRHNFGLDVVRGTAILLVLICHCGIPYEQTMSQFGFFGVELFFALSGFLIGQIVIRDVLGNPSFKSLVHFYQRRWLRTLPLYYLVLMLLIIVAYFSVPQFSFPFANFVFLQNFSHSIDSFFNVSWSLSIEEWSYLLIPLLLLLLPVKKYSGLTILIFTITFAAIILFARGYYVLKFSPDTDFAVRKSIPLRMDAIIYGFAMANIKLHFPKWFQFFCRAEIFLGALLVFIILNFFVGNVLVYDFIGEKTIPASVGFTITGILFTLFLPFLSTSPVIKKVSRIKPINIFFSGLSKYSYCIYLIHLTIFEWMITSSFATWLWLLQVAVAASVTILIAAASYRYFEKPILDWRDRNVRIAT